MPFVFDKRAPPSGAAVIVVVVVDRAAAPCVVARLAQVRLHVAITTWCGVAYDTADGVYQVPDGARVCDACAAAIASANGANGRSR